MKPIPLIPFLLAAGLVVPVVADTIRLKDGTTYEGKVLSEDGDQYVVEVQVTRSIKDEKRIPKADVDKILREEPDLKAFTDLPKFVPTPDLLEVAEYDTRIAKVQSFLKTYPTSKKATEAKAILATLQEEQKAVAAGGVKINGALIPAAERSADLYDIDSRVLASAVRNLIASGNFIGAYGKYAELEKEYPGSAALRATIPAVVASMKSYNAQVTESLAGYDKRMKERTDGINQMSGNDRATTARAIAEQDAEFQRLYEAEKKAGNKWPPLSPDHKASLDETKRHLDQDIRRLEALKIPENQDGGKAWREAWTAILGGDEQAVRTALSAARSARLPQRYLSQLEDKAKASGIKF